MRNSPPRRVSMRANCYRPDRQGGWSVKIARVAGTEIRLHITFLIFLAWIGFAYYGGPR